MKALSRQRLLQKQWVEQGKCSICGAERDHYAMHCDACYAKVAKRRRRSLGQKAWKPGGRGRPPKVQFLQFPLEGKKGR